MRTVTIATLALLLLLLPLGAVRAQSIKPQRFSVELELDADKDIKATAVSYVSRELRSLGDVDVVDNAEITIFVSILPVRIRTGEKTGYVLSYDVTRAVECKETGICLALEDSGLQVGDTDLRGLIERVITRIDGSFFAKLRKKQP